MTKQLKLSALVLALSAVGSAYAGDITNHGWLHSKESGDVVKNAYGECWQAGENGDGLKECNPAAPAPTPTQPVIQETKESFSTDVLFAFDKSQLSSKGKATLNEFAQKLSGMNITDITIAGHTDYFGTERYNQRLSERRANSVKNYLASRNINRDAMQAKGYGESQQTLKDKCLGEFGGIKNRAKRRLALIKCIAGDRRVDVTVHYVQ